MNRLTALRRPLVRARITGGSSYRNYSYSPKQFWSEENMSKFEPMPKEQRATSSRQKDSLIKEEGNYDAFEVEESRDQILESIRALEQEAQEGEEWQENRGDLASSLATAENLFKQEKNFRQVRHAFEEWRQTNGHPAHQEQEKHEKVEDFPISTFASSEFMMASYQSPASQRDPQGEQGLSAMQPPLEAMTLAHYMQQVFKVAKALKAT
jgi:hypothetical protein